MRNKEYFKWYLNWYQEYRKNINIMLSPASFLLPNFIKGEDVIVLQAFNRINKDIDYKYLLRQILKMADNMDITIYLEHSKVYHSLSTDFYEGSGFDVTEHTNWYIRTPKH